MTGLHQNMVDHITKEAARRVPEIVPEELEKIILFGSCARGNYGEESDVDIAVLVSCDREGTSKYQNGLVELSAEMDLRDMVVVNFVCLPYTEFLEKKNYYPFYANIERDGKVIYG